MNFGGETFGSIVFDSKASGKISLNRMALTLTCTYTRKLSNCTACFALQVTSDAINGGGFVQLTSDGKLRVNPIFKWYKEDFDKEGGTLTFIRKHWTGATQLPADVPIEFFEYDWRTNSVDSEWANRPLGGPAP